MVKGHIRIRSGGYEARFPGERGSKTARTFPTHLEAELWLQGMSRGRDLCKEEGMVYVLWPEGLNVIKIGRSAKLDRRIRDLQHMCPSKLHVLFLLKTRLAIAMERHIHLELAEYRLHGEWFSGHAAGPLLQLLEGA